MSEELKGLVMDFVEWFNKTGYKISDRIILKELGKHVVALRDASWNNTRTPDINTEMLSALKDCVNDYCSNCLSDRMEECTDPITCTYFDYKQLIEAAQEVEGV